MKPKKHKRKPEPCYHVWTPAVSPNYRVCDNCGKVEKVEKQSKGSQTRETRLS